MNVCITAQELESMLLSGTSWTPFARCSDRAFWQALPEDVHTACVNRAQDSAGFKWPPVLAADFMAFIRDGNRVCMEDPYFARRRALVSLVLGECAEGEGRFIDDIINGIWAICEETSWTVSAHSQSARYPGAPLPDPREPIVDLFAAETAAILAWSVYLLHDQLDEVTAIIAEHAVMEIDRRVIIPYQERWDFWYMGRTGAQINNWTPWIASNVLGAALLLIDDTVRRAKIVEKSLQMLQTFLDTY